MNGNLRDLRSALAALYPTEQDALRIATDAGLSPEYIDFNGSALNFWNSLLAEAERRGKVEAVLVIARAEYPESDDLAQAAREYETSGFATDTALSGEDEDTENGINGGLPYPLMAGGLAIMVAIVLVVWRPWQSDIPLPTPVDPELTDEASGRAQIDPSPTGSPTTSLVTPTVSLPTITPMPPGFNIALAQFVAMNNAEEVIASTEAVEVAGSAAAFLAQQTGLLEEIEEVTGEVVTLWGPERQIPPIIVETAATHAISLNADILIFGTLRQRSTINWELAPAFYVADSAVGQAEELLGPHALGTLIPLRANNQASQREFNLTLQARLKTLTQILTGLAYYELMEKDAYEKAAEIFREVAADPGWGAADDATGQEIIYLFLGSAYLQQSGFVERDFLATFDPTAGDPEELVAIQDEMRGLIDTALEAYETGLAINDGYARLQNSMGIAYYMQARLSAIAGDNCAWQWSTLELAKDRYRLAIETPTSRKLSPFDVDIIAHAGLGRALWPQAVCLGDVDAFDDARRHYETAISIYDEQPERRHILTALLSHAELADLLFSRWQTLAASPAELDTSGAQDALLPEIIDHYNQAILLSLEPEVEVARGFAQQKFAPLLLIALCFNGQTEDIADSVDAFSQNFADPDRVKEEVLARANLPEECRNEN